MKRRPARARDVLRTVEAAFWGAVLEEAERQRRAWAEREVAPVLRDLRARVARAGPLGEPFVREVDRALARLTGARRRKG